MQIIDVTLRDGGHQHDFAWPRAFGAEYVGEAIRSQQIDFVEIGYWKQSGKFSGDFYALDEDLVGSLNPDQSPKVAVMVDFHYCARMLDAYPFSGASPFGLIRMTSRREDVFDASTLLSRIKAQTGALTSLNLFNISNYSQEALDAALSSLVSHVPDFVYFADTHGSVDLAADNELYSYLAREVSALGATPGFHLHNHTGKAYHNFRHLDELGFRATDISLNGLGKGMGNLPLEHVLGGSERDRFLELWRSNRSLFEMSTTPFGALTGNFSVTDHYADQAEQLGLSVDQFTEFISSLGKKQRDNFESPLMLSFVNENSSNGN